MHFAFEDGQSVQIGEDKIISFTSLLFAQSRLIRIFLAHRRCLIAPKKIYRVWEFQRRYSAFNDTVDVIRRYGCGCVYYHCIGCVLTGKIGFGNFYE